MSNNEYPYDYNGQDQGRRQAWGEVVRRTSGQPVQPVQVISQPTTSSAQLSYDLQRRFDVLRDQIQRDMADQRTQLDELRRQAESQKKQSKSSQLMGLLPMLMQKNNDVEVKTAKVKNTSGADVDVITDLHYKSGNDSDSMLPIVLTLAMSGGLGGGEGAGGDDTMPMLLMLLMSGLGQKQPQITRVV
jgi:hypothetical protein